MDRSPKYEDLTPEQQAIVDEIQDIIEEVLESHINKPFEEFLQEAFDRMYPDGYVEVTIKLNDLNQG